ncbi:MAG: hypothetical protein WA860_10470, partial [Acidimicrobiales bacterium]
VNVVVAEEPTTRVLIVAALSESHSVTTGASVGAALVVPVFVLSVTVTFVPRFSCRPAFGAWLVILPVLGPVIFPTVQCACSSFVRACASVSPVRRGTMQPVALAVAAVALRKRQLISRGLMV